MASFCVVGAGIIGLSSALCIAKRFHGCKITIIYDQCSPDTVSNHGFGLCGALHVDGTDCPEYLNWAKATVNHLSNLRDNLPSLSETGIREIDMHVIRTKEWADSAGKDSHLWDVFRYSRPTTPDELDSLGVTARDLEYVLHKRGLRDDDIAATTHGTWVIDADLYLPWMLRELKIMEARYEISHLRLIKRRIHCFSDLRDDGTSFDCIINCSGLASQYLVPDNKVVPIRGQYLLMNAEEITDLIRADCESNTFIVPMLGRVKVGPTHQIGRNDTDLDPNDSRHLLKCCESLCPILAQKHIIKECVGIRPGRIGGPRLELEYRELLHASDLVPIVHNYGHGSHGFVQHWGCAVEAAKLVEKALMKISKL